MKSTLTYIESFGSFYLSFKTPMGMMHHDFFVPSKSRFAQIGEFAAEYQKHLEEGLQIDFPEGYIFAGVKETHQPTEAGFRKPSRNSATNKKTDAKLGPANWLLFRLPDGYDPTFIPLSDWVGDFPRGAAASVTQPHQLDQIATCS